MKQHEMIQKFIQKVNQEGHATVELIEATRDTTLLALAVVVKPRTLITYKYVLFNDGTYIVRIMNTDTSVPKYIKL